MVGTSLSQATGFAERDEAFELINAVAGTRATLAADRGYDTKDFVNNCRERGVTPHVARKKKHSAIDGRTTRHMGFTISQRKRKLSEQVFGSAKTVGSAKKLRFTGLERNADQWFITMSAFNIVRMAKLMG